MIAFVVPRRGCAPAGLLAHRVRVQGRGTEVRYLHARLPRVLAPSAAPAGR